MASSSSVDPHTTAGFHNMDMSSYLLAWQQQQQQPHLFTAAASAAGFAPGLNDSGYASQGSVGNNSSVGHNSSFGMHSGSGSLLDGSALGVMGPPPLPPFRPPTQQEELMGSERVPGRLGLLNDNKPYYVPVAELKRRLEPPENLNISYLNGILRRAKGKVGAKKLRDKLEFNQLNVPHNKRTESKATRFTPLVEEEAIKLAEDFERVARESVPTETLQAALLPQVRAHPPQLRSQMQNLHWALCQCQQSPGQHTNQNAVEQLSNLMDSVGTLLLGVLDQDQTMNIQQNALPAPSPLGQDLQAALWRFNLNTHNFGVPAMKSAIKTLCKDRPRV